MSRRHRAATTRCSTARPACPPRRLLWMAALCLSISVFGCAGNIKSTQTRRLEQERFLAVHAELNGRLDSLNALAKTSESPTGEAYTSLFNEALAAVDTLTGRSYYRYQVQQVLETGYRILYNYWRSLYNASVRAASGLRSQRMAICKASRDGAHRRALTIYTYLESNARALRDGVEKVVDPSVWIELDRRSSAANRLPNPPKAPVINLSRMKEDLADLSLRFSDLQASIDGIVVTAADSLRGCTRQEVAREHNRLVRTLNAGTTKDGAGHHGEAMAIFDDVHRRAFDLYTLLSSDSLQAIIPTLAETGDIGIKEQVQRLMETAEGNLRAAEYNYALSLYDSLARQFRRGQGDPSLIVKEIDYLLTLSGVDEELESRLKRLRARILESLTR